MNTFVKNIKAIYRVDAINLRGSLFIQGKGAIFFFNPDWERLPVAGLAECAIVSSVENKSKIYKTTVAANLSEFFDPGIGHYAYLLEAVDGSNYVVGTDDAPFPAARVEHSMPGEVEQRSGTKLTIEYADTLGLMPVLA